MQNILMIGIVLGAVMYVVSYLRQNKQTREEISLFGENHESCAGCILPKLFKNPH